jgi:hypothetical protein
MVCREFEWNGFSISHLLMFCCLGFLYPDKFIIIQIFGIIFEILEYILSSMIINNNSLGIKILNIIGGRHYYSQNENNTSYNKKNKKSPTHLWFDYWIQPPSELHWWHAKISDVFMNIIGNIIGIIGYSMVVYLRPP